MSSRSPSPSSEILGASQRWIPKRVTRLPYRSHARVGNRGCGTAAIRICGRTGLYGTEKSVNAARCTRIRRRGRDLSTRFRHSLLQLQAALFHHQRICRPVLVPAMEGELEAVRQQGLEHFRNLMFRRALRNLRCDVESRRPRTHHPIRPCDSVRRDAEGIPDQHRYRRALNIDPTPIHLQ